MAKLPNPVNASRCGAWRNMDDVFDLPEGTMIVATYDDWSGGEVLVRHGIGIHAGLRDLDGEPSSMLPDLAQYQIIGVDRCPHEQVPS